MKKIVISTIMATTVIIPVATMACDNFTEEEWDKYEKACPLGDALLYHKGDKRVANMDCINYDTKSKMWEVWYMEGNHKVTSYYRPNEWDVYTEDGKIDVRNDKVVLTEKRDLVQEEDLLEREAEMKLNGSYENPLFEK